jgi:ABC-type Fe3+/spermidine/putrescine transport system ATPase subunit
VAEFIGDSNLFAESTGASVVVRPERIRLRSPGEGADGLASRSGRVEDVLYLGERIRVVCLLDDGSRVSATLPNEGQLHRPVGWTAGTPVLVCWRPEDARPVEPA